MKKSYHSRELPSNPAPSSLRQFLRNAASFRSSLKPDAVLPMAAMISPDPSGPSNEPPLATLYPARQHPTRSVSDRERRADRFPCIISRMADVTVFTQRFCGCCADAKRVLRKKGVAFREVPTKE